MNVICCLVFGKRSDGANLLAFLEPNILLTVEKFSTANCVFTSVNESFQWNFRLGSDSMK